MNPTPRVVSIGHAIVDVLAPSSDELVASLDLEKGTMTLVDAERSGKIYASLGPATEMSGGSAANTAACLASLDTPVAFVGRVGDDALGEVFTHDIRAAGVTFAGAGLGAAAAGNGLGTGRCLILVTPDAEKTMCSWLGAGAELLPSDLDEEQIAGADVLYTEGYLCAPGPTADTLEAAIEAAVRGGTAVALSLSDPAWVEFQGPALERLLDRVDILFANEHEAVGLTGAASVGDAVDVLTRRCTTVAVTLGADGALLARDGEVVQVPAAAVEVIVDTTGAGDSYAAGFLSGFVQGADLTRCGQLGSLAAGEVVSHLGARPQRSLAALVGEAGLA